MNKVLIIGNGVAGIEAAINIRKLDEKSEITIVSEEKHIHYYRPRLIEYIGGKVNIDDFTIYKKDFYYKNNIISITEEKIVELDPVKKTALSDNGKVYNYTKLLIATGASSFKPPIEGSNLKGVFTLRNIEDADKIKNYIRDKTSITILGGGILGLEIANSIKNPANNITVIEMFDRLLPRQLDREGSEILKDILVKKGLSFILGDTVLSIEGKSKPEKIKLKSGNIIDTDCVIISAGVRANIDLAKKSGIKTDKGILIDNHFKTSDESIFAAGDCAEHNKKLYGLWSVSKEQGKLAGMNIAGKEVEYKGSTPSTTLKVTGIDLFSGGNFEIEDPDNIYLKREGDQYLKLLVKNNKIVGAIALGNKKAVMDFKLAIDGKKDIDSILHYF